MKKHGRRGRPFKEIKPEFNEEVKEIKSEACLMKDETCPEDADCTPLIKKQRVGTDGNVWVNEHYWKDNDMVWL